VEDYTTADNALLALKDGSWDNFRVDGLVLPNKEMLAYAEDTTSEGSYKRRYRVFRRNDINSQLQLNAYATKMLGEYKDIIKRVHVQTFGATDLRYPGYNIAIDSPDDGVDNNADAKNYRVKRVHNVYSVDNPVEGHDWVCVLDCIKRTASPGTLYIADSRWDNAQDKIGIIKSLARRIKTSEVPTLVLLSGEGALTSGTVHVF